MFYMIPDFKVHNFSKRQTHRNVILTSLWSDLSRKPVKGKVKEDLRILGGGAHNPREQEGTL